MSIVIKKLSPQLSEDYFDFFDNRAFSDNSPYYPCYCNAFYMTNEQIKEELFKKAEEYGGGTKGFQISARKSAQRMVAEGIIQGYLAYEDGISIGWCNASDRRNYAHLGEFNLEETAGEKEDLISLERDDTQKIKSIVCFEITPSHRGKGIATALLNRVCEDAKREGYDKVEVYPTLRDTYEALDFTGPVHLYEKAGFVRVAQHGKTLVMQKDL